MSTLCKKKRKKLGFFILQLHHFLRCVRPGTFGLILQFPCALNRDNLRAGSNSWGFSLLAHNFDLNFRKICKKLGWSEGLFVCCGAMTRSLKPRAQEVELRDHPRAAGAQGKRSTANAPPRTAAARGWLLSLAGNLNCSGKAGRMGDLTTSAPRKKKKLKICNGISSKSFHCHSSGR